MNHETKDSLIKGQSTIDSLIKGQVCTFENVRKALQMVIPQKLAEVYPGHPANDDVCMELEDEIMDEVAAQRENSMSELL